MWEQFLGLINGLEDSDSKTNLLTAFGKVKQDNDNAIAARDEAKGKNKPLADLVDSLKKTTGLEDLTAEHLATYIKDNSKTSESEAIKTVEGTLATLREQYSTLESTHTDYVNTSKDKAFELALTQSDIFKDVSSDPFLRNAVIDKVKPKLIIGDDGLIYAKGEDGKVLNDIVSGKPITGAKLFEGMVSSGDVSKHAINSTVSPGTNAPNNTQTATVPSAGMSAVEMMKAGRKAG